MASIRFTLLNSTSLHRLVYVVVCVCWIWPNWDWPSGLSWEALWLFFPSPTIPIILAPKLERLFLSSSSSSFLPSEQISPPTLEDFCRGPDAGAGLEEEQEATTPVNHPEGGGAWTLLLLTLLIHQCSLEGKCYRQPIDKEVGGVILLLWRLVWPLQQVIVWCLTLEAQAPPPPLPPPLIQSSVTRLLLLRLLLLLLLPVFPPPTPLIGLILEPPTDCLSQREDSAGACRQERAARDRMMKSKAC